MPGAPQTVPAPLAISGKMVVPIFGLDAAGRPGMLLS